jgi:hypothetical protein
MARAESGNDMGGRAVAAERGTALAGLIGCWLGYAGRSWGATVSI